MGRQDEGTGEEGGRVRVGGGTGSDATTNAGTDPEALSTMELSSMPLDPIYAWGIVLEPVEVMIEDMSRFVAHLARRTLERGEPFSDEELEGRFLGFFDHLVEKGTLRRLPDAPPAMGCRILGPRRWLEGQRIRMRRLMEYWEDDGPSSLA